MEQSLQPNFIRQTKSKAIAIINPNSGERLPLSSAHKPANTFSSSSYPASKDHSAKFTPSTPSEESNEKTAPASELEENSEGEGIGQAFDVYTRPFVPEVLTIINIQNGQEVDTPATKEIDFRAYVCNSISLNFLPPIPQPLKSPISAPFALTDTHYEYYFQYHLEAEIQSQRQENESYSLYEHDVTVLFHGHGPNQSATCSFLVPGLRENSPYVEEDDVIQLRQLRYDNMGRLLGVKQWPVPYGQFGRSAPGFSALPGQWRDERALGWTGKIYNARVSSVLRAKEQLFVRVCGLTAQDVTFDMHPSFSEEFNLKFNIQFPVPRQRYSPMRLVLPIIQNALNQANGSGTRYQGTYEATTSAAQTVPSITTSGACSSQSESVSGLQWLRSMLFPTEADCEVQTKLNPAAFNSPFFDKQLNWEQQKAVESIRSHNYGTLPFLISGPPGTGKTKTLVEIALQLVNNVDKVAHILLCAPSDPAADTLIQRLSAHFQPTELLRLNRPSRTFAEVSATVLPFCYTSQNTFYLPPFKRLMSYRIVVTTCRDASILMFSRMTNLDLYAAENGLHSSIHPYNVPISKVELHWSAVLIDEAAQATEPEALIPLAVVAPPLESVDLAFTPLFVMVGDEHQLGPRTSLHSSPLKTSLFARLFARPVYANHPLARSNTGKAPPILIRTMLPIPRPAFANLIRNYRSHPAILAVPSTLFYADTLEPEATNTDCLASWSEWQGRRWPVLFHNNGSEDEVEKDGGGWYNIGEAQIACRYAALLVQTGLVAADEVCIMSPFKAQVRCIRKTIRGQQYGSFWDVNVGPTEAFQGLEKSVVILCTTRSKQRFVNKDKELGWGIIGMPNKMNVALTRAKFGLIVIGKRDLLLMDPHWKSFLDFCERNGLVDGRAYDGSRLVDGDRVEFTRLETVLLAKERGLDRLEDSRVLRGISQDDEMWMSGVQARFNMENKNNVLRKRDGHTSEMAGPFYTKTTVLHLNNPKASGLSEKP